MKVFLSADMEGTCGIVHWNETERNTPFDYTPMQKQMTREVAAACRGALAGGADEVMVKDAHDSARNIDPTALPRKTRMHRAWSGDLLSMMCGLDKDKYDAVFFTGYHAWASCPGNALSHTMNLRNDHVTLNGELCPEFLINAYTAGYFGVPVALVTGDKALCDFAKELIPAITISACAQNKGHVRTQREVNAESVGHRCGPRSTVEESRLTRGRAPLGCLYPWGSSHPTCPHGTLVPPYPFSGS